MRRACRKIWRSVPCTSRKSLRTESRKDMEEILRAKLSTIKEEPELCEENLTSPMHVRMAKKQVKKGLPQKAPLLVSFNANLNLLTLFQ
ncbi:uncharacterized protein HKW66_Vig0236470 [Vigna angularis]|uniref:Uncharacterized protein n=2 Tax=Phaseolus angularis TaxID=3914 RepID=A0A8T0KQL3_PHAAN|nr:uncharacterized protein HKW66_Vig0236470 [Vigna angularis]BAT95192.1 hypothetical protein VIGAN_08187000 [Vigna angularis var. angularis]